MGRKRCLILFLCLILLCFLHAGAEPVSPQVRELDTGLDGPVILIVAGIHGDEVSGIYAAEELNNLPLTCGKLCWISPANPFGAEQGKRRTRDDRDLNRNFPGDPNGNSTKQLAYCITQQILELQPDLILDLHEATAWEDGWDNLGSSVIFADLDPVADLIFEMMDMEDAPIFFSSPPTGSINAWFSREGQIPVLTLEASREAPLEARMEFHRQIIVFILSYYHMM